MNLIYNPTREYHEELFKKYEYYYNNKFSIENFSFPINILDIDNIYTKSLTHKKISLILDDNIFNTLKSISKSEFSKNIGTFIKTFMGITQFIKLFEKFIKSYINITNLEVNVKKLEKLTNIFKREHCKIFNCQVCQGNNCGNCNDFDDFKTASSYREPLLDMFIFSTIYTDQYNNLLLVNKDALMLIHNKLGIIGINSNGFGVFNYPIIYQKCKNNSYFKINLNINDDNVKFKSILYNKQTSLLNKIDIQIDNRLNLILDQGIKNIHTNKIEYFKEIDLANGNLIGIYSCDGFKSEEYILNNKSTRITKTEYTWVSTCPKDYTESGIRFRGTYKSVENIDTKNVSDITLKLNGKSEYVKKNNVVLIDNTKTNLKTNCLIGWKVAKDDKSNPVIIKLEIEPNAKIIRPIDPDYYLNHQKERCNKAKVIDIQKINLSDINEEISIGNLCDTAYSYIYEQNAGFTYRLGSIVEPDCFDEDNNKGCANGIHYFQSRESIFKTYLKEYQKNHLKQD